MLRPFLLRAPSAGRVVLAGVVLLLAQSVQAENMMDRMVRKFCLQAVNNEIKASGKPAPDGMPDYTCNCVVEEMRKGESQQQASATCKAAATKEFNL
jgi:hypothetical protein